jgi:hypothetical protein
MALGNYSIKLRTIGYCDIGKLRHIVIVPKMTVNLIIGSRLDLFTYAILIKDQTAQLIKGPQLIAKDPLIRGLYHVKLSYFVPVNHVTNIALVSKRSSSSQEQS